MARRASSSLHPGIILAAIAAIAIAIFAGKSLLAKKSTTLTGSAKLSVEELLENGNSLRGNEYLVEGQIEEKLQWTPTRGQLISLKVPTPSGHEFVAIEIPPSFNQLNIDSKQKYAFRIKFREGGIAVATDISRL